MPSTIPLKPSSQSLCAIQSSNIFGQGFWAWPKSEVEVINIAEKQEEGYSQIISLEPLGIIKDEFPVEQFVKEVRTRPVEKEGKIMERPILIKTFANTKDLKRPAKQTNKNKASFQNTASKKYQHSNTQNCFPTSELPRLNSDKSGNKILSKPSKKRPLKN